MQTGSAPARHARMGASRVRRADRTADGIGTQELRRRAARRRSIRQPGRTAAAARHRRDVAVPAAQGVDLAHRTAPAPPSWCPSIRRRCCTIPASPGSATRRMLVRMDGVTFLTDPIFSERASPVSFAGPAAPGGARRTARRAAAARLRHHLARPLRPCRSALDQGAGARAACRSSCRSASASWCARPAARSPSSTGGSRRRSAACSVHCVPAQHFSGRSLTDGNQRLWAGWVVVGPTRRFYHAGDTGYFDGFRDHRRAPRPDRSRGAADRRLRPARDHALRAHESRGGDPGRDRSARHAPPSACTTARSTSPTSRSTNRRGASTPRRRAARWSRSRRGR